MNQYSKVVRLLFASSTTCLGALALVYGHLGLRWYSFPAWIPWPAGVAYASGAILVACGIGLFLERTAPIAMRALVAYLLLWLLLRVPTLVRDPLTEVNWQNAGELAVLFAAAWTLRTSLDEQREQSTERATASSLTPRSIARYLFIASLIAFGLSHFAYANQTSTLVPAWLPFHSAWAYLTGTAHLAAAAGILLSIHARLAAKLEATMLSAFTILVWIPAIVKSPADIGQWTEFVISTAVTAGAWVMAERMTRAADLNGGVVR